MIETATIPLSRLRPGDDINPRQVGRSDVKDLIASIKAVGLVQPIVVRPAGDDSEDFEVIDGNRRLAALKKIAGKKDHDVACVIRRNPDAGAREDALVANIVRVQLHPADEYEAFQRLIDDGLSVDKIAARFATKERWIRQRLQLAKIAPEIRAAWRNGKITAEQAEAFSAVADHDRQRAAWDEISKSRDQWSREPGAIRRKVAGSMLRGDDMRLKLVGDDAYIAAGGLFSEDLFSDDRYALNPEILDRLVDDAFRARAEALLAEGWAWVLPDWEYRERSGYSYWGAPRLNLDPWMTPEERSAFAAAKYAGDRNRALKPAEDRAAADPDARSQSGVILSLRHEGKIEEMLFVLAAASPEDDAVDDADSAAGIGDGAQASATSSASHESKLPTISKPLRLALSETMTLAVSESISGSHDVALAALIASIRVSMETYHSGPIAISARPTPILAPKREQESPWADFFENALKLPLLGKLDEIARLVGVLIDFRFPPYDPHRNAEWWSKHREGALASLTCAIKAEAIAAAIWKRFDPEAYFSAIPAALIDVAVAEMGFPPLKGKKAEKAKVAAEKAKAFGWLPPELCPAEWIMRTPETGERK